MSTNDHYAGRRELAKDKFSVKGHDWGVIIFLYDDGTVGDRPEDREEARRMVKTVRDSVPQDTIVGNGKCERCKSPKLSPKDMWCRNCGITF